MSSPDNFETILEVWFVLEEVICFETIDEVFTVNPKKEVVLLAEFFLLEEDDTFLLVDLFEVLLFVDEVFVYFLEIEIFFCARIAS